MIEQTEQHIVRTKEEFNELYQKVMQAYETDSGLDEESFMQLEGMVQILEFLTGESNELELPVNVICPNCDSNDIDVLEEDDENSKHFKFECMECGELFN